MSNISIMLLRPKTSGSLTFNKDITPRTFRVLWAFSALLGEELCGLAHREWVYAAAS